MLFSHKKEGEPTICNNMDEPGEYYAKLNKPEKDKYRFVTLICAI